MICFIFSYVPCGKHEKWDNVYQFLFERPRSSKHKTKILKKCVQSIVVIIFISIGSLPFKGNMFLYDS